MRYYIHLLMLGVLVLASSPALAGEPYYFSKVGVSREKYVDDVNDCAALAGGVRGPRYQFYAYSASPANAAIAAGIGSFFASLAAARERRRLISQVERTCMADKGYERRAIDKVSHREINNLPDAAKLDRLFTLVAAEQPTGKVLVE